MQRRQAFESSRLLNRSVNGRPQCSISMILLKANQPSFTNFAGGSPYELSTLSTLWHLLEFGEWLPFYTAALYNVALTDRVPRQFLNDKIWR
jgi:hypothetical protein